MTTMHDTPLLISKQCTVFFRVAESETAEASNVSARGCSCSSSALSGALPPPHYADPIPLSDAHTSLMANIQGTPSSTGSLVRTPGEMDGWMLEWWRGAAGTRDRESECLECFMVSDGDCDGDGDARSSEPDSTDRPAPAAFSRARRHVARLPCRITNSSST